jgi:hypothetical protein
MKKDWKVTFYYIVDDGDSFVDFLIIRASHCGLLDCATILVDEAQITFNLGYIEKVEEYKDEE